MQPINNGATTRTRRICEKAGRGAGFGSTGTFEALEARQLLALSTAWIGVSPNPAGGADVVRFGPTETPKQFESSGASGWNGNPILRLAGATAANGNPAQWLDAGERRTYVAVPTNTGIELYAEQTPGVWSTRNLTRELGGGVERSFSRVTAFKTSDGVTHVVGVGSDGQLWDYRRTPAASGVGSGTWSGVNVSAALADVGLSTPAFVGDIVGFASAENGFNIVGMDAAGSLRTVFTNNRQPGGRFRLGTVGWGGATTALAGAVRFASTAGVLNLFGTSVAGELLRLSRTDRIGTAWTAENLTVRLSGLRLVADSIAVITTAGGTLTVTGFDSGGDVRTVVQTPGVGRGWRVSNVNRTTPSLPRLAGPVMSLLESGSTLSIFASGSDGATYRYIKGASGPWRAESLNAIARERALSATIRESDSNVNTIAIPFDLDSVPGRKTISFTLRTRTDRSGSGSIAEDSFNVYVVDPNDRSRTLIDRGRPGTAVLSVRGSAREFVAGLVQFDGERVTLDVSSLRTLGVRRAVLLLQTINTDSDTGSTATVSNITFATNTDSTGASAVQISDDVQSPGPRRAIAGIAAATGMVVEASRVRFDAENRILSADLRIRNATGVGGSALRSAYVTFSNLPAGVRLRNASGRSADGRSYINFSHLLGNSGLQPGMATPWISVSFGNPQLAAFTLGPAVVGAVNRAPVANRVPRQAITPGGYVSIPLTATDADGDRVRFTIRSVRGVNGVPFPTSELTDDNMLVLRPTPSEIGRYVFDVVASDGIAESSKRVIVDVVADAVTTTRVSGRVLGTNEQPLVGVPVIVGNLRGTTDAQGRFLLEVPLGTSATSAIEFKGSELQGTARYPFVAEKLELLLGRSQVFSGFNNVIGRPIYLPVLDSANATPVDPSTTTVVRTTAIPGAAVTIAPGTLRDMADPTQPFRGQVSITQVPRLLTPAALPPGQNPDMVVTIQPGDMQFTTPAPLSLPNTGGFPAGTTMDLWSINPNTGLFDRVGTGRVSSDGTRIDTISGGIRNSSWHFFSPPPDQAQDPNNDPTNEDEGCPACGGTTGPQASEAELHSGELIEMHSLVPYQSQGISRQLTLRYGSLRADPRPILHLSFNNVRSGTNNVMVANVAVERGSFRYEVPGADGMPYGINQRLNFWNAPTAGGTLRAAVQADLHDQPTGRYQYRILQGILRRNDNSGQTRLNGSMASTSADLIIVNERSSRFGTGWTLGGVQRIVENPDGSALLVDGDGSQLSFVRSGSSYQSPSGDFTTLTKLSDGTWTRRFTNGSLSTFDSFGQLVSVRDRNGNTTTHNYDAAGRLLSIVDPVGLTTTFSYDAQGKVSAITDPAGRATRMSYDAAGNLVRITDPDGSSRSFQYDADGRMIGEIDKRGFTETEEYDSFGRVRRLIRSDGTVMNVMPVQVEGLFDPRLTRDLNNAPTALRGASLVEAMTVDSNGQVITQQLDRRGQVVSSRDSVGNLSTVRRTTLNLVDRFTDARGNVTTYTYDSRGNVRGTTDPVGSQSFEYDSTFSQVTRVTDGLGRVTRFDIDPANGNVTAITAPDGTITRYTYNSAGQPLTMTDARGTMTEYVYDTRGRILRTILAKGTSVEGTRRYQYDAAGNQTAMIDENGNRTDYTFDAMGRMLSSRDAVGNTTQYIYDADGNLIRTVDARGNATQNRFDARDRLVRSIAADGSATVYAYDQVGNLTSMTDPNGLVTRYEYDARNRLLRTIDPRGGVTGFGYDASDNLVQVTDPLGNITRYAFDSRNRVTSEAQITTGTNSGIDFNFRNWQRLSYRNSIATLWTVFDNNGAPEFRTDSNLDSASFVTSGMVLQDSTITTQVRVDPRSGDDDFIGVVFSLTTAPSGTQPNAPLAPDNYYLLSWKQGTQGNLFSGGPGEEGIKLLKVTGSASVDDRSISAQIWDGEDTANVDVLFRALGSDRGWAAGVNYSITLTYSGSGTYAITITNADTGVLFQRIDVTDSSPLQRGQFGFFSQSQSDTAYSPSVVARRFEYDRADNLTAATDRNNRRIEYLYDTRNRVTRETWIGGSFQANYTYDAVGNRLTASDPFSVLTATYDERNRLSTISNAGTPGLPTVVLSYRYDAVGNVLNVSDNIGGSGGGDTRYTYDRINRLVSITQQQSGTPASSVSNKRVDFSYNQIGQYTSVVRFNDLAGTSRVASTSYTYDNRNRVNSIAHNRANGQPLAFFNYAYDAGSRITSITDIDGTSAYSYDTTNQVTGADYSTTTGGLARNDESFNYDLNGNRVSSSRSSSYRTGPHNRLLEDETYTYDYDDEGNLTRRTEKVSSATRSFTWDYRNRLTRITDATTSGTQQTVEFTHDADGRRLTKTTTPYSGGVAGTPVSFSYVYDGEDIMLTFRDGDGAAGPAAPALDQRVLHGPNIDEPLMIDAYSGGSTRTLSLFADHLGTIRAELNQASGALSRQTFDAFGAVIASSGPAFTTSYAFTGRELDRETGLMYYRARYYDVGMGRFVSEDPLGHSAGDANIYRYTGNQVIVLSDPSGLFFPIIVGALIGAALGAGFGAGYAYFTGGDVGRGALLGAASGAVGVFGGAAGLAAARAVGVVGASSPAWIPGLVGGSASGAAGSAASQLLDCGSIDRGRLAFDTGLGAITGGLFSRGPEIRLSNTRGNVERIAPFGNRTGSKFGEYPHYHRRVPNPSNPQHSLPGQSIDNHRPYQGGF